MTYRVGWHCLACNRFFQGTEGPVPERCEYCGSGPVVRIDHSHPNVDVDIGDTVVCDIVGEVEELVVGVVVDRAADRLVVEARDGRGRYTVKPEQVVGRR